MQKWTQEEVELLRKSYNAKTNGELLLMFKPRSKLSIYKKAYSLGLRKDKATEFANRSAAKKGCLASNWNGGKRYTNKGYKQVLAQTHPRADSSGYVMEHIIVFEQATGINVPLGVCVHHINGNKDDNRIENLCIMTNAAHTIMHHVGLNRSDETRRKISDKAKKRNKNIVRDCNE